MQCTIYKGKKKEDHYIFVKKDYDTEELPEAIRKTFGELQVAMEIEVTPEKKLANSDPVEVLNKIEEQGFFLQIPPKVESLLKKPN